MGDFPSEMPLKHKSIINLYYSKNVYNMCIRTVYVRIFYKLKLADYWSSHAYKKSGILIAYYKCKLYKIFS